jgi:hypothetical protein
MKGETRKAPAPGYTRRTILYRGTDYYCPYCGKQDVWQEVGGDDYYTGTTNRCFACEEKIDGLRDVDA